MKAHKCESQAGITGHAESIETISIGRGPFPCPLLGDRHPYQRLVLFIHHLTTHLYLLPLSQPKGG